MTPLRRLPAAALAVALVLPAGAAAQSAEEIVVDAVDRYEQRMEGVENYTVVQEVMGFETSTRFERQDVDGRSIFVVAGESGSDAAENAPQNYQAMLESMGERATVEGTETVDGTECHVLQVTDFSGDAFGSYAPPETSGEWTPKRLRLLLDREELLPRKMIFEGEMARDDGTVEPVTLTAFMRDSRDVDGVVHPYTMEIHTEGMTPAMSPEERDQMQAQMKQLQEQMAEMSPQQREMMQEMMGGQLEQMEKMLSSGAMDFTVNVKEIRVNREASAGG